MPEGEWVRRGPLDAPVIDFVCLESVRIEGDQGAESGFDMMEFLLVDHTTDPEHKPISHLCRFTVGMALALSHSILAWVNEEPPEWQQGRRHIHLGVEKETEDHSEGIAVAFWVEPTDDHGKELGTEAPEL